MSDCDACDDEARGGVLHEYAVHTCGIASPMDREARRLARETGMHWEPGMHGPTHVPSFPAREQRRASPRERLQEAFDRGRQAGRGERDAEVLDAMCYSDTLRDARAGALDFSRDWCTGYADGVEDALGRLRALGIGLPEKPELDSPDFVDAGTRALAERGFGRKNRHEAPNE